MIVSIATAVLPVWRSPMISSRWPRPIGTIESIDLQAGLHRLVDRLARDHARSDLLDHVRHLGVDRALAVDRLAQRVDHAADQLGADRHFQDAARALDGVAFGDVLVLAQDHRADRVALEVQRQAEGRRAVGGGAGTPAFRRPSRRTGRARGRCRRSRTRTVPWLRMSALAARPSMRLLISSEISAGLSCMTLSSGWLRGCAASGRQRDFHLFQAGLDRGVEHLVAHHHADAADQGRVFLHGER